ncbi:MAG: hypothetical protein ACM3YO_08660 [Bacteroidota bacterium]
MVQGINGSGPLRPLIAGSKAYENSRMASDIAMGARDAADLIGDSAKVSGRIGYGGGIAAAALSAAAVGDALIQVAKNPAAFGNYSDTLMNGLAGMADGVEDLIQFAQSNSKGFDQLIANNPALKNVLQKIGGPAAIVSGLINLKNSIPDLIDQIKDVKAGKGDMKALVSSAMGTMAGGLSVVGGALMMTGAGAPVGTALVAAGGVISVAQYALDNWDNIKEGAKKVADTASHALDSAASKAKGMFNKLSHMLGG